MKKPSVIIGKKADNSYMHDVDAWYCSICKLCAF